MKISQKLPQFKDEKSLFIVTGSQGGEFYIAANGVIKKTLTFKNPKPEYPDKGGFFQVSGKGQVFKGGSPYESPKNKLRRSFRLEFRKNIKKVLKGNKDIENIYIFSPGEAISYVKEALSKNMRGKVKFTFRKDYINMHPFELLKRIKEKEEKYS